MSLSLIMSQAERLASTEVMRALREGIRQAGAATLLVPSFSQVLDVQRSLAVENGLALGIEVTTPSAWVRDTWEVWGDGRALADGCVVTVLSYEALRGATEVERGPLAVLPGVVEVLAKLVMDSLPWLPLDDIGRVDERACEEAGLSHAETCLVRLAGVVARMLEEHGYVSPADASVLIPTAIERAGATVQSMVLAGFSWMKRSERELVGAVARGAEVTFVAEVTKGAASDRVRHLLELLHAMAEGQGVLVTQGSALPEPADLSCGASVGRRAELQELLDVLYGAQTIDVGGDCPVELLLPAGPLAEAELVAERVAQLVADAASDSAVAGSSSDALPVVVATDDVERAYRELVPKLAERNIAARVQWTQPLVENAAAQAFLAYAAEVARLSELAATWPEPQLGLEGPIPQLGDMSWWPPRELVDFLFQDMAHVEPHKAWRLDSQWRGNRLLTPARVLQMLQTERLVSAPVARATQEILRGRMGSAAAKLLAPYNMEASAARGAAADEARAVLMSMLKLANTLHALGVSYNPQKPEDRPLSEVVSLMTWAMGGRQVVARLGVGSEQVRPQVLVLPLAQAAELGPASAECIVVCGLTSVEQPVEGKEGLLQALLELLGVEPKAEPLATARAQFRTLLGVARSRIVLEHALADADGAETYPSVMLSELLAAYGVSSVASPSRLPFAHLLRSERLVTQNLSDDGVEAQPVASCPPAPAGRLTDAARELVFVPQGGRNTLPDGLPVLSASQIETYLDCPYKWFSLRRLRLGSVDAGHSALEMGSFAHRVMEVTHRELLLRALADEADVKTRDAEADERLLAMLDADPARHIAGSRVDASNLEQARAALELEFDLHQEHMCRATNPRAGDQLLVAHDSAERAQEQQLKEDLLSSLEYEGRILEGFEPRFFEWGFGRHDQLVRYAGAYFTGTVDRIDVNPHGMAVIIDYKHKSPTGFAAEYDALQDGVLEGACLPSRVQSLIYAQVVRRAFEGRLRLVGSVYLSTKSPHALAGVADENVADLVFGSVSARRLPRVCVPPTPDGAPGMDDLLDHTEELIAEQVQQMLAGNVEARPRDQRSCDYCPVMQCERRMAR